MEPLWEYRWEFVETGHWGGVKDSLFYMTDEEATRWWAYGLPGTRRLDETKRDRNEIAANARTFTGSGKPWNHGGVPYE